MEAGDITKVEIIQNELVIVRPNGEGEDLTVYPLPDIGISVDLYVSIFEKISEMILPFADEVKEEIIQFVLNLLWEKGREIIKQKH